MTANDGCGESMRVRSAGLDGAPVSELRAPVPVGDPALAGNTGTGRAACHHGELLQGMFLDERDGPERALVTLPMGSRGTRATFRIGSADSDDVVRVFPEDRAKARRAAELTIKLCTRGRPGATGFGAARSVAAGGQLDIASDVPVGCGMGSSTSDVIAAIRAVSDCYGMRLAPERVARLAVLAERASDSIMIEDRVVLFAHRRGVVLEVLGSRLPPLVVVGCVSGPAGGVDTLDMTLAQYARPEIETFCMLLAALRRAIITGDIALLGWVATMSARINQRFLPKPELDFLIALAGRLGAAGVQIAHSGTVAGLIFDSRLPDLRRRIDRGIEALGRAGIPPGESFLVSA